MPFIKKFFRGADAEQGKSWFFILWVLMLLNYAFSGWSIASLIGDEYIYVSIFLGVFVTVLFWFVHRGMFWARNIISFFLGLLIIGAIIGLVLSFMDRSEGFFALYCVLTSLQCGLFGSILNRDAEAYIKGQKLERAKRKNII